MKFPKNWQQKIDAAEFLHINSFAQGSPRAVEFFAVIDGIRRSCIVSTKGVEIYRTAQDAKPMLIWQRPPAPGSEL